jgi:hypothetical protein
MNSIHNRRQSSKKLCDIEYDWLVRINSKFLLVDTIKHISPEIAVIIPT